MPTGYTNKVEEGQSFEDFVLGCARAFDACIHQRDDDGNDKPTKRDLGDPDYHENLLQARKRLDVLQNMTTQEQIAHGESLREKELEHFRNILQKTRDRLNRYVDMQAKVETWAPPTAKHQNLKEFMLQQLRDSIRFDCNTEFCVKAIESLKNQSVIEAYNAAVAREECNVKFYQEHYEESIQRARESNAWIEDLYKSLGM